MKIYKRQNGWEFWHDRCGGGNWWAAKMDSDGNQIGDAEASYTRKEAEEWIDLNLKEEMA